MKGWRPWAITRPTKWAFVRIMVLGTLGGWLIPLPWQQVTAEPPLPAPPVRLGPQAITWLESQMGAVTISP
jgi:hypothetical protein